MNDDSVFRLVLVAGWLMLMPVLVYHRIRSQATGERLDRRQEAWFILLTLRPVGLLWSGLSIVRGLDRPLPATDAAGPVS